MNISRQRSRKLLLLQYTKGIRHTYVFSNFSDTTLILPSKYFLSKKRELSSGVLPFSGNTPFHIFTESIYIIHVLIFISINMVIIKPVLISLCCPRIYDHTKPFQIIPPVSVRTVKCIKHTHPFHKKRETNTLLSVYVLIPHYDIFCSCHSFAIHSLSIASVKFAYSFQCSSSSAGYAFVQW